MDLAIILETTDPEKIRSAFRLATLALNVTHDVDVFLLGEGVEVPDLDSDECDPNDLLVRFTERGGNLFACEDSLASRGLTIDDLRIPATTGDFLEIVETSEKLVTFG